MPGESLYTPAHHRENDPSLIRGFMEEYSFAMLVTAHGGLRATHIPTLLDPSPAPWGSLLWHIARDNPQSAAFESGEECLAVFRSPDAYISPAWYETRPAVPTWNFATVHARGVPRRMEDPSAASAMLARLVAKHETPGSQWEYSKLPAGFLASMRNGIIAYEMPITDLEAKFKLGQERSPADREGILCGLAVGPAPRNLLDLTRAHYSRTEKK